MKPIMLIASFFLFSTNCFCQSKSDTKPTKAETEQWIKEKLASFSYDGGSTKHNYSILFEGGDIIITNKMWMDITGFMTLSTRIKISDLDFLSVTPNTNNVWLTLHLQAGKTAYEVCEAINHKVDIEGDYDFILSNSFKDDNMPERMKKAFSRLSELNGGKTLITKEAY